MFVLVFSNSRALPRRAPASATPGSFGSLRTRTTLSRQKSTGSRMIGQVMQ